MPKHKKVPFYKRKTFKYIVIAALIFFAISTYVTFNQEEEKKYEYMTVEQKDLVQEISVTGQVKAIESVDLTFETSGRVSEIFVEVGDEVKKGDKLLSLNNSDIYAQITQARASVTSANAQLAQYQATLESEEVELTEMKKGTRPEEITIAKTEVSNAKIALKDAETSLKNTTAKTEIDLNQSYANAMTSLLSAVNTAKSTLITFTDIQNSHFSGKSTDDTRVQSAKADAAYALFGTANAGDYATTSISNLTNGIYGEVQGMISNYTEEEVNSALIDVIYALQKINIALNTIPIDDKLNSTEKTSINTSKTSMNSAITSLTSAEQTIAVQKITNSNLISTSESAVNTAKNLVASTEAQLALKEAGYTNEQIASKEARIRQVEANIASQNAAISQAWAGVSQYQAILEKTILSAPIDGVITRIEAKVGEIVFPSSSTYEIQVPVISLIGEGEFEVETYIPEVDIASVKVEDKAMITLDTYGSDEIFEGYVKSIDPAETMIEGVTTYKTKFLFSEDDERIKSGMTANLDVVTAEVGSVIAVPQRAVIYRDSEKVVRVLVMEEDAKKSGEMVEVIKEMPVDTGIRGKNGYIEITSGISEGDKVVTKVND